MSRALLLTAYGSRHPGSHPAFTRIQALVRARHPGLPLAWCYTSRNIRRMAHADSPVQALARLADAGVRRVAVQSLHLIPGAEYAEMLAAVREQRSRFERVARGPCLLATPADVARAAGVLAGVAAPELAESDAVVFVGHGADHPGNAAYLDLGHRLAALDARLLLGLLEFGPGLPAVRDALQSRGAKRVTLLPLFFSAGYHAAMDLAGPGPDSWRSVLAAAGLAVRVRLKGSAEHDAVAGLWLDHLDKAVAELG